MKTKASVLTSAVLLIALSTVPSKATTVDYSFMNTIGGVAGAVTVQINGLTVGATSHASSVILLSYPSALNPQIIDAGTNLTMWGFQDVNTFTLDASGNLVSEDFDVAYEADGTVEVFTIDSITPPLHPEPATPSPIDFLGYGPYSSELGPGPYPNVVATVPGGVAPTPESATIQLLGFGLIGLGVMAFRRKLVALTVPLGGVRGFGL